MPETWTPQRYPRLVILHSTPLPTESNIRRSFNFNKLRSILTLPLSSLKQPFARFDIASFIFI